MTIAEQSVVTFGSVRIEYHVRRSQRRRTVALCVDRRHGVVLTAPLSASLTKLDQIVRRKARWIMERRRRLEEAEYALTPREFVSGESALYLGRHYRLRVIARGDPGAAAMAGGWLIIPVHQGRAGGEREREAREKLTAWYRRRAAEKLPERVSMWAPKVGLPAPPVLIRDQEKRWASCDRRGALRFNWRIIQAPARLIDYVVVHELLHLRHPNHQRIFWRELGVLMPDYDARREALRRIGPRLEW